MKVKDLIARLNESFKPNDELIVAYWDKEIVEGYSDVTLTDNQWIDIVAESEIYEPIEFEMFGEKLQQTALEVGKSIYEGEINESEVLQ